MKLKNVNDIHSEEITMFGSSGPSIQWLWGKNDGVPRFALRRYTILPNGIIGKHSHEEEHEIFILEGEGVIFSSSNEEIKIKPQDTIYVPPNEEHGYRNTGKNNLIFLCIIPILTKK